MRPAAKSSKAPARYAQVKESVRHAITSGQWPPGHRIPSEHELTRLHSVARMTVNRALRELTAEGLIERTQGVGSFVATLHPISSMLRIRDIHEEILERGHRHTSRVLTLETIGLDPPLAKAFSLRTGGRVFHMVLVHRENDVPIQIEDRYVNPAVAPDFLTLDFSAATPSHYLFERAPLTEADQVVEAVRADAAMADALGVELHSPCLQVSRRTLSGARVASVARLIHPGERFRLMGSFKP